MLARVARRRERGIEDDSWAEIKLAEVRRVRQDAERQVAALRRADPQVANAVEKAYLAGSNEAIKDLEQLLGRDSVVERRMIQTHQAAVTRLVGQCSELLYI